MCFTLCGNYWGFVCLLGWSGLDFCLFAFRREVLSILNKSEKHFNISGNYLDARWKHMKKKNWTPSNSGFFCNKLKEGYIKSGPRSGLSYIYSQNSNRPCTGVCGRCLSWSSQARFTVPEKQAPHSMTILNIYLKMKLSDPNFYFYFFHINNKESQIITNL